MKLFPVLRKAFVSFLYGVFMPWCLCFHVCAQDTKQVSSNAATKGALSHPEKSPAKGAKVSDSKPSNDVHFQQMLKKGFHRDPKIQAALETYKGSKYDIAHAWFSSFMPGVSARATTQKSQYNPTSTSVKNSHSQSISVSVQQNLFNSGASLATMKKAQLTTQQGVYEFQNAQNQYVLRAVGAYMGYITAKHLVEVNEASVHGFSEQHESAKIRAQLGDSTLTDVAQAQAAHLQAQSKLLNAKASFMAAERAYREIFDEAPTAKLSRPAIKEVLVPKSVKEMVRAAEQGNLELRVLKARADGVVQDTHIARAALLPKVDVSASVSNGETSYIDFPRRTRRTTTSTALTLTVPILNNGGTTTIPSYIKAQHSAAAQQNAYRGKREDIRVSAVKNWEEFMSLRRIVAHNQSEVQAAKLRREGAREEFKVGSRTMLEVLDAETKYLESEVQLAQNRQRYVGKFYEVLSFVGGLDPKSIGLDASNL